MTDAIEEVEVLVCGGGSAGMIAAIQAARAGAQTLLIEANGMLGGTTTVGGVDFPGLFHAEARQIIAGIGWELVTRCADEAGLPLPDFSDPVISRMEHWRQHVRVDAVVLAALAEQTLLQSGGNLLLHTMLGSVTPTETGWRAVICCKEGLRTVDTRILIDCTGNAAAVEMAGFDVVSHEPPQPGTQMLRFEGYDLNDVDLPIVQAAYERAIDAGELRPADTNGRNDGIARLLRSHGQNANHIAGALGATSHQQTRANIDGRACALRLLGFLRRQKGLQHVRLARCATVCGIRQGRTIVGRSTITIDDYRSGRVWADAVCNSYYPTDLHRPDGESGIRIEPMPPGVFATIPRGAMLPRDASRLLVAGQCIAGDQLAHSAYRVQATAMAVGQAAGAIAAVAAERDCDCADVEITRVHDLLTRHDAILPGQSRPLA